MGNISTIVGLASALVSQAMGIGTQMQSYRQMQQLNRQQQAQVQYCPDGTPAQQQVINGQWVLVCPAPGTRR